MPVLSTVPLRLSTSAPEIRHRHRSLQFGFVLFLLGQEPELIDGVSVVRRPRPSKRFTSTRYLVHARPSSLILNSGWSSGVSFCPQSTPRPRVCLAGQPFNKLSTSRSLSTLQGPDTRTQDPIQISCPVLVLVLELLNRHPILLLAN